MSNIGMRRAPLSRHYDLLANHRLDVLGHRVQSPPQLYWHRFKRSIEAQFLSHYFADPPRWRLRLREFGGKRALPDFCVVGPIKSGTSDLAVSIMSHPNVMVPLAKEFWSSDPEAWRVFYPTERSVRRHAARYGSALLPYFVPYIHSMDIPYNLSRCRLGTKVVLTLRDPSERVYSQWKWEVFLFGRKHALDLPFLTTFPAYVDKALDSFPDYPMYTLCGFPPLQTSMYWKAVKHWMECFGGDNVLVLDVADYFRDRSTCLREIFKFVGVPYVDTPGVGSNVNENPLSFPKPDDVSMSKLRAFFAPYNNKLWDVIQKSFKW